MDIYKCPISEMSKNFPKKNDVVTIKYFYALLVFLFLFFCDDKKKFISEKYLELLYGIIIYGNIRKQIWGKKWGRK